jgi:hypothetical protein
LHKLSRGQCKCVEAGCFLKGASPHRVAGSVPRIFHRSVCVPESRSLREMVGHLLEGYICAAVIKSLQSLGDFDVEPASAGSIQHVAQRITDNFNLELILSANRIDAAQHSRTLTLGHRVYDMFRASS